jgi:uncharacterized protein
MLIRIDEFRQRIASDCDGLVADLQQVTGRYGSEEAQAWKASLGKLDKVFQAPSFQPLYLYFGGRGNLALEYQLPAASSWADVVMLGAHEARPAAVIIELKDWITRADKPGRYEGLIERQGTQELHPSDQVRGYTEYCRRFHSTIADRGARVHGCVLFTRDEWADVYSAHPNQILAEHYPLFTLRATDVQQRFPNFFQQRLTAPDEPFAQAFAAGRYKQNRGFVAQIATQILNPKSEVFELLDNQRTAFNLCRATIEQSFFGSASGAPPKKVIIIKGPPGSGKSVIAARLWATLVTDTMLPEGDVVFTTTSQSQNSNWSHIFDQATGIEAARGVIRKATTYTPVTPNRLGRLREKHGQNFLTDASQWKENLRMLQAVGEKCRDGACDNQNLVTIVDEAHGLINPENPGGLAGQFGFATTLGPQAYHIIRSSLLTIFLLDPLQGFRQRENTSIENIRTWADDLGAGKPEEISLEGTQFRCAGSAEYVTWIQSVLSGVPIEINRDLAKTWYQRAAAVSRVRKIVPFPDAQPEGALLRAAEAPPTYSIGKKSVSDKESQGMEFRIFDEPEAWETALRQRSEQGMSARILATYCREWKTESASDPHSLPNQLMDFNEQYDIQGETRFWSRIWNYVPHGTNYTWFVTGHPAGRIATDPLCEVGCPYAIRGFDYDYVGVLWLDDLLWQHDHWEINLDAVHESGITDLVRRASREKTQTGLATREVLERTVQAYRILFTRALKGLYVWIPDADTRRYVADSLA